MLSPIPPEAARAIRGEVELIGFLRRELGWPIHGRPERLDDLPIPAGLRPDARPRPADERIRASRLLAPTSGRRWGVYLLDFQTAGARLRESFARPGHLHALLRGVDGQGLLRRLDEPGECDDLLLVCVRGWREIRIVHVAGRVPGSARIVSFGWRGPDDPFLATLCRHNLPRLRVPGGPEGGSVDLDGWHAGWPEAFRTEPMAAEWQAALRQVFGQVQAGVPGPSGERRWRSAALLILRLVYLKLVERRGWLNGEPDYLRARLAAPPVDGTSDGGAERHRTDFLSRLCFEGLSVPAARRSPEVRALLGDVPYLNVDLLARSPEWDDGGVEVDGNVLRLVFERLLDPYAFGPAEVGPLDAEVALTHEVLGSGYEEMIARGGRGAHRDQHAHGAYYTQPAEAGLMCREALRAYLSLRCPAVDPDAVASLVCAEPPEMSAARVSPEHAASLYAALHDVTVCDPAVGAGTFPVAMLRLVHGCLRALGERLADSEPFHALVASRLLADPTSAYELKAHVVERSLFGADVDRLAVQVARARLGLELLAERDDPAPLPNLAQNLLVGESLVSAVGVGADGRLLTLESAPGAHACQSEARLDADRARRLVDLRHRRFGATDPDEALRLGGEIAAVREDLLRDAGLDLPPESRTPGHVLWQLDFPEVFQRDRPGFDVVIANPPYLRQELIDRTYAALGVGVRKADLRRVCRESTGCDVGGQADLYVYFLCRGLTLLKREQGVLCLITSNSWLDVEFGGPVRRLVARAASVRAIVEGWTVRSFGRADVNAAICLLVTGPAAPDSPPALFVLAREGLRPETRLPSPARPGVYELDGARVVAVPMAELRELTERASSPARWGAHYLRAPSLYHEVARRLGGRLTHLPAVASFRRGLTTGSNAFFLLTRRAARDLRIPASLLRPVVSSMREVETLTLQSGRLDRRVFLCPYSLSELREMGLEDVAGYVEERGRTLTSQRGRHTVGGEPLPEARTLRARSQWWTLRDQEGGHFLIPRLLRERFCVPLNPERVRATDMFFCCTVRPGLDPEVVGALLNSTLVYFLMEVLGRTNVGGRINFYGPEIRELSLPRPELFSGERGQRLLGLFQPVAARELLRIEREVAASDRRAFDEHVLDALGIRDLHDAIVDSLVRQVSARVSRESSGRPDRPDRPRDAGARRADQNLAQ